MSRRGPVRALSPGYSRKSNIGFPNIAWASRTSEPMAKTLYRTENSVLRQMLRGAREQAGLTQGDVSKAVGKSQTFLSDVERGVRRLDVIELWEICQAMGLDLSEFIAQFEAELARRRSTRPQRARASGRPRKRG